MHFGLGNIPLLCFPPTIDSSSKISSLYCSFVLLISFFINSLSILYQGTQPSSSTTHSTASAWDSGTNFELNDADEVVLNMLLAQSSMDTLLDPTPWPDTDNLLDYLNMNPDLTSD